MYPYYPSVGQVIAIVVGCFVLIVVPILLFSSNLGGNSEKHYETDI